MSNTPNNACETESRCNVNRKFIGTCVSVGMSDVMVCQTYELKPLIYKYKEVLACFCSLTNHFPFERTLTHTRARSHIKMHSDLYSVKYS